MPLALAATELVSQLLPPLHEEHFDVSYELEERGKTELLSVVREISDMIHVAPHDGEDLAAAGDDDDLVAAHGQRFLHPVLDDGRCFA